MPWANYHSHSLFCDGKAAPKDFIAAAIDKKFLAYGFSAHAPVPFPSRWNMPSANLEEYLEVIHAIKTGYADQIEVYVGLEVDYIDEFWGYTQSGLKDRSLDYFIGSVHYIGKFQDGSHFCFDGQPEAFFQGIAQLYQNNFKKAIKAYFRSVMRMVEVDCPDIVGHLDKIKMHNTVKPYFSEDEPWYTALIEETLEVIRQKGCIVEVNTRGLYKHDPPLLYPGTRVLETIRKKKIPVMINSDAHHPNEVELGFATAAELLYEMGFRTLRILKGGKWHDQPFAEKGLIF